MLNHPKVSYFRLPDEDSNLETQNLSLKEFNQCFNPIKIAKALEKENIEWLQFYIKFTYNIEITLGENPFTNKEFLGRLIKNNLAVLNHSKSKDMVTHYIMPMKNVLLSLQRFPNKKEKVLPIIQKTQNNFFDSYDVLQLGFLLKEYNKLNKETNNNVLINFYNSFSICKSMISSNFNINQINSILEALTIFYNNYKAIKNEKPS